MNGFYGDAGAGSGAWKIFKVSGNARFSLHPVEGWPSGPSVWIQSDNAPFDAGIYQQVAVTPGTGYHFSIPFAVMALNAKHWQDGDQVNRRVGIDPFGGTDANSANIVWSPDFFGMGRFEDDKLAVDAYAKSAKVTVFIRAINPYTDKHVDVYLDSPTLQVNTSMAPIQVTAPTATNAPPPATKAVPPTARPTQAPTEVAEQPTDEPADTPVPTETVAPSVTAEPQATAEPSDTPTKVPTRVRRATPTPMPTSEEEGTSINVLAVSLVGITGFVGIVGAGILFLLAFIYWRRAR